jgi:hypothetical protein
MKKWAVILLFLLLLSGSAIAADVTFKLKGSYFHPYDTAFKDIYGGGVMYGVEASTEISQHLEMWIDGGYFSKKGELSLTKEETKLRIIPVGGGLRYSLSLGSIHAYAGIGINYWIYNETNRIGDVNWGKLGGIINMGSFIKIRGNWIMDFFVSYSYCEMQPADFKINIGGIEAGIRLGYSISGK